MEKKDKMNDKMENFKIVEIYKNNQISILKQNYENENQNSLNGLSNSLDTAEQVISEVENMSEENIQISQQHGKRQRWQYIEK